MNYILRFLACCGITLMVGCTNSAFYGSDINHTPAITSISQLENGITGLFVYRESSPEDEAAVNIYIDHAYFASLLKNTYRFIALCPGEHTINTVYHSKDPAYKNKIEHNKTINLIEDEIKFLRLGEVQGNQQIKIEQTNAEEVATVLSGLTLQDFTHSRVTTVQNCH